MAERHKWKCIVFKFQATHTHTQTIFVVMCGGVWPENDIKHTQQEKKCKPIRSINVGLTNINYSNCYYICAVVDDDA